MAGDLKKIAEEVRPAGDLRLSYPLKAPALLVVKFRAAGPGARKR